MNCWIELIVRIVPIVTAVATVIVAIYVGWISRQQSKTNQEKLRFDLYQRRFEIYLRVLDFHFAIWQQDEPKLALLHVPFMKAFWESKFLFPEESGIYDFLDEYNLRTSRVRVDRSQIPPRSDLEQYHASCTQFWQVLNQALAFSVEICGSAFLMAW